MKWLILTAHHTNPGDQWARIGCEHLVRDVDPEAILVRVNKHTPAASRLPDADRLVIAGMPIAWAWDINGPWRQHWWKALARWVKEHPPCCALFAGVGSCVKLGASQFSGDVWRLRDDVASYFGSCLWYSRDTILPKLVNQAMPVIACPSTVTVYQSGLCGRPKSLKLINLMPTGHWPDIHDRQGRAWKLRRAEIAFCHRQAGYNAIAHSPDEYDFAKSLGFENPITHADWAGDFLDPYSQCSHYVGLRVHGGIVAQAFGAQTCVIGWDSRCDSVRVLGGSALSVTEFARSGAVFGQPLPARNLADLHAAQFAFFRRCAMGEAYERAEQSAESTLM